MQFGTMIEGDDPRKGGDGKESGPKSALKIFYNKVLNKEN